MIKCVVFDLDGLLIDSERIVYEIYSGIAERFDEEFPIEMFAEEFAGRSGDDNAITFIESLFLPVDTETIKRMFSDIERSYMKKGIPLKKGAKDILAVLKGHDIKCVIASSGSRGRAEKLLEQNGIKDEFAFGIYGDETERAKPDPEIFLKAFEKSGFQKEEIIILEDSSAGTAAAYEAGIRAILIPDMELIPDEIKDSAYAVCTDLNEAAELIEKEII